MKLLGVAALCVASFAFAGCGSDPNDADGDDTDSTDGDPADGDIADGDAPDDGIEPDAPLPGDWEMLIGRSWTVPAGSADTYKCVRIIVDHDMWIAGFQAVAPTGTHHTVVTIKTTPGTLGDYDCSVGSLDSQMLYASGVGTDDLVFPAGVAMKIKAGTYLNLNLHLFNASDNEISGTSGIMVKTMTEAQVVHEADMVFAGSQDINIPSDGLPHEVTGGCNAPREWNIFTVWPHMHQFATHSKLVIGGETLLDTPYSFEEQTNYPEVVKTVPQGMRIDVTCTFVNNSGTTVTFGDSSNQEMCFTGMYKWPAGGNLFQCALE